MEYDAKKLKSARYEIKIILEKGSHDKMMLHALSMALDSMDNLLRNLENCEYCFQRINKLK